jgi:hypothetical protein
MSGDHITKLYTAIDLQQQDIKGLNRGFIMFVAVLERKGLLNKNEITWIDKIKRSQKLTQAIDKENLLAKVLDVVDKVPCSENIDEAINTARNYVVKPKIVLPKL